MIAGWASDRFGAPRTFAVILVVCGLVSIASAYHARAMTLLFAERVIVAIAGVSFVVGIQHVAQWFNANEIGTAEGLYAGTGNVGAGMGALAAAAHLRHGLSCRLSLARRHRALHRRLVSRSRTRGQDH